MLTVRCGTRINWATIMIQRIEAILRIAGSLTIGLPSILQFFKIHLLVKAIILKIIKTA